VIWDLDPQGAATWTLQGTPNADASAKKLVLASGSCRNWLRARPTTISTCWRPDFSYRKFDLHLHERKRPTERLLKMSAVLREKYAYLFLDCPPGISRLSENVLRAADAIVVPLLPAPLSVRMLAQLQEFIAVEGWSDVALLPFFSMVDRRKSLHAEVIATTRARFRMVLQTEVPYWSEIERMSVRRAPLPAYAPDSAAAQIFRALGRRSTASDRGANAGQTRSVDSPAMWRSPAPTSASAA